MKPVSTYLNFAGTTEEAFELYRSVLGGEFAGVIRFRNFPGGSNLPESDLDKIAHMALPLPGGSMLMGTDVLPSQGQSLVMGNNTFLVLEAEDAAEAHRVFDGLSADGVVEMPLSATSWAELYGICHDRYGVGWMVTYPGSVVFTSADHEEP
jgi:PhnB protein